MTEQGQELRVFVGNKEPLKAYFLDSNRYGLKILIDNKPIQYSWSIISKNKIMIRHYPYYKTHTQWNE